MRMIVWTIMAQDIKGDRLQRVLGKGGTAFCLKDEGNKALVPW